MPGLVRKILISATASGIVLQPQAQRGQHAPPSVVVTYKDIAIGALSKDSEEVDRQGKSFEAFGIIGLLNLSGSTSFLISITRRQQVAQIQGKAVYVVTEVALTPLSSRAEAEASIARTNEGLLKQAGDGHSIDDSSDCEDDSRVNDDVDDDEPPVPRNGAGSQTANKHKKSSSVAEEVMTRKGIYGRFVKSFQRRNTLGLSTSGSVITAPPVLPTGDGTNEVETATTAKDSLKSIEAEAGVETKDKDVVRSLLPKLIRTTQLLFGLSRGFYFSYDYDITRNFANRRTTTFEVPLHTEVDPLFFWNRHVIQPFIDAGQSSLVLPLMQGFVGQRAFEMDTDPPSVIGMDGNANSNMEMKSFATGVKAEECANSEGSDIPIARHSREASRTEKSFLLTLISRRSVKRAGLRYLRRGVDEDGNTANGVETEQILSAYDWSPSRKIYSFVQIRGSIPIFFSQTPYSFKPVPQIQHSDETNYKAFKKHFDNLSERYGSIQIANLVEKYGNEAIVGDKYEENMKRFNEETKTSEKSLGFEWFDFHSMCRGMKFENVGLLIDSLGDKLDEFSTTVEADGHVLSRQTGVLRTNCMDCLDRTNVVQSACGRRALDLQLKNEGIDMSLQVDQSGQFFNTLWADNGDAISKQYASTGAMKGDFTRTGKRDYKGALTDMSFSIARFYSGIVNDYFSQAAIDFLLGNVTTLVFEDFESNLNSIDPGVSMQKMRQQAIDTSQKIVVADDTEEFIGGWCLLVPHAPNTIKSSPFEEAVLLLTDSAIYAIRFDWTTEKVLSFERVDLTHVVGIKYGTYITSTLSPAQANEKRNVGFLITYRAGTDNISRVNTRSMSTSVEVPPRPDPAMQAIANLSSLITPRPGPPPDRVLAFKALPSRTAVLEGGQEQRLSEIESVKAICAQIERMVHHWQEVEAGTERNSIVEAGEIISLADARKSTGLLEQLGHSLKKLVWA